MKKNLIFVSLFLLIAGCTNSPQAESLVPVNAYLGQKTPGDVPEIFAPGIVSTGMFTRDIAMTPDGREIYFCISLANYTFATILVTKEINGKWTQPEVMEHMRDPKYMNLEPCISPDGKKFFFLSNRPDLSGNETAGDEDIWVMDRNGNEWSEPYNPGEPVNSQSSEFFPSVTKDGTLYFTRSEKESRVNYIFRSKLIDGKYQEPEKLPPQVNSGLTQYNAFIDPDEKYLIVPVNGRNDTFGSTDYYIVYRNPDDTWDEPVNMGNKINTVSGLEFSPYVSPDGKYFFFMSSRIPEKEKWPKELTFSLLEEMFNKPGNGNSSIYWVDSKFISENKPTLTN
jgi:ribosomal protein L24E